MNEKDCQELTVLAKQIRLYTVKALNNLGFGHYGGSLSIAETLAVLYGKQMNIDPTNPDKADRDYFILSKGHAGPALYATLALKGYFGLDVLKTLNCNGTTLPSHPDKNLTQGVDMTTGSLGQGISVACGLALGLQMNNSNQFVYCIVGDGELNEGQCWEAIQFAAHQKLAHLIVLVDDNKKQLDGFTKDVCNPMNFQDKFSAFGFDACTVDGHNIAEIDAAITNAKSKSNSGKPHCIVLNTLKGKGIAYLEEKLDNHHLRPSDTEKNIINDYIATLEQELGKEGIAVESWNK